MTWKKKGNRIRASDKSLVYHFCIGWLLLLFVAVFLLLNLRQLLVIDWKDFNLLHAGITWTAYNSITVLIATGVCALVAFLYYRYGYDRIKRLLHRQKLARMVLENKWYEAENTKDSGFFTDLQSRSREKIVWFPKIYYQMDNGLLHILCEITMGKYQEQLLSLEDKLESGLYCELTDKTLHDGYIEYTLLYDMIANRISIDEVIAENGGLRLMKNLVWEYDSLPHALICGGTGGGKTYFLLTIIEALLKTNADLYILDPKNADLADLGTVMGNVYHTKDDMIDCVNAFYEGMFYNISTDYPFFMVAFLQIICFAGIYMKLGELMSMFSLNANDSQQIGRRIFRRPMVFMRHRARRMEHRIARAVGAGSVAGAVAGASVARAGKPATNQPPKKRENTSASMGSRVGSAVGAVMDTKNKVRDSASSLKENVKDLPTQAGYAVHL